MIRRVLSILLYIISGAFLYGVCLFSVIDGISLPLIIFVAALAILALVAGLAIMRFQDWRREAGIVLLSATGFTTFLLLWAFLSTMPTDISRFFGNPMGVTVIVVLALAGALLVITSRKPRTVP
jgi:hypothetical protein